MENTINLSLPYIMPSQAQKHVTHNEALDLIDAIAHLAVLDRDLTTPPGGENEGDRYIVAAAATGAWAGHEGKVAYRRDDGWTFLEPRPGWVAFVLDEPALLCWTGTDWASALEVASSFQNLSLLGVGATADAVNPFSAKLNKALWTALTTGEGGTGDLRYTLNKQATSNILSVLMQSNWSGRAEIGLVGDDDLAIKVSADGSAWNEALRVDRVTGRVSFPRTNVVTDALVNLLSDAGRFSGGSPDSITVGALAHPAYLPLYNGAVAQDAGKFINNNNDYGGAAGALDTHIRNLVDQIRSPAHRRYGLEFRVARIVAGTGTTGPVSFAGVPHHMCCYLRNGPHLPMTTFHIYIRALDAPAWLFRSAGQTISKNGFPHTTHVQVAPGDGWVSVTVHDMRDPYTSAGYNPTPFSVYTAASGHRVLIACPTLMAGIMRVDDNVGVVPNMNAWPA